MKDYWEAPEGSNDNGSVKPIPRIWDWETAAICLLFAIACVLFLFIVLPWLAKYGIPGVL